MELRRIADAGEWEHFNSQSFYALSMESLSAGFLATVRLAELGHGIRVGELVTGGMTALRRTSKLVAAAPSDHLLFLIQVAGQARVEQAGRQMHLLEGQGAFCDPSEPYAVRSSSGHQIVAIVPRQEVLAPRIDARQVRLRPLSMSLAPLRVFRHLADEMTLDPGSETDTESSGVAVAAQELLRSAATTAGTAELETRSWSNETRLRSVKRYLLGRLGDPTVTMDQVAAANGISPRQLRAIFGPGDSPAAFLRRERLRRARGELTDPRLFDIPVSTVASRWGFVDSSTFGRAYRGAFGETPRESRIRAMIG